MREYARICPSFWTGNTGRTIKLMKNRDVTLTAFYLITNTHTHMTGMYYLPIAYIMSDTGLSLEEASNAMFKLKEIGFCAYDDQLEYVWIKEMARYQIAEELKGNDNRIKPIHKMWESVPALPFLFEFYMKYKNAYSLPAHKSFKNKCEAQGAEPEIQYDEDGVPWQSAFTDGMNNSFYNTHSNAPFGYDSLPHHKGLSKVTPIPLPSQEQEQEQDINIVIDKSKTTQCPHEEIVDAYHENLPMMPPVKTWNSQRQKYLRTRWNEDLERQDIEWWKAFFIYIASSDFLTGKTSDFTANLEWIVKPANFIKILEGNYNNKKKTA